MESNKLTNESSPYLLQHADNPVNWFPWGQTAIELARKQDKPILLSIGYSACHWCHVMMHEAFCDPNIAATMNRLFINIKVDKEERPDLDKIYQTAHQLLMNKPGGWPLTMFLSPHTLLPYYAGTYFPVVATDSMPDFQTLLHKLNDVYYHEKEKIKQQELHMLTILQVIAQPRPASESPLAASLRHETEILLQQDFDPENTGFGETEKFPNCTSLDFLLNSPDKLAQQIAITTLNTMAHSGLYDQLGSGFFRYTVDPQWQIPHFEKMLYDNVQLLSLYTKAYKINNSDYFRKIALELGEWLATTMQDITTGGFYTSIDADSEAQEGLYYVWDLEQIKQLLTHDEYNLIRKYYQLDHKANFDHKWHLVINTDATIPDAELLLKIKQKLLQHRDTRIAPKIDTKILTAWNGLAIKSFSEAGQILSYKPFLDLADKTISFMQHNLLIGGQLYATLQDHKPKIHGFLDDYAFFLDGLLAYINHDPEHKYINLCKQLADDLLANFYDIEYGGFFFTAHNNEHLFYRPKIFTDDATPSGSGTACQALLKLGKLVNNQLYINAAKHSINAYQIFLNEAPELHLSMLEAYSLLHA